MNIEQLPKGAIPDSRDNRDYQASDIMGAVTVDFSKEFRLPVPPDTDQGLADACVAHAWSYYQWQLRNELFSRRDLFSRIALAYGASIRDGGVQIVKNGQAHESDVPDPSPETPQNMRDGSGTSQDLRKGGKELSSFVLPQGDINGFAWGIQAYNGIVFGVSGSNPGWQDMENPRPPAMGETIWGHALYGMGYHTHSDGQKCIIAKSSWCNSVKEHHIREFYFTAFNGVFNGWTLIPLTTTKMTLVNDKGTVYVVTGNKDKRKIGLADLTSLGLFGDEPQTNMDTSGIPEYNTIVGGTTITHK